MGGWSHVPSHKLNLCRIEKVMNTVLADVFCSLNKQHSHDRSSWSRIRRHRIGNTMDFEAGCDWNTANGRGTGNGWKSYIFYRDPLTRFLSAFLSKCTDGHDPDWDRDNICRPIFGSRATGRLELTRAARKLDQPAPARCSASALGQK